MAKIRFKSRFGLLEPEPHVDAGELASANRRHDARLQRPQWMERAPAELDSLSDRERDAAVWRHIHKMHTRLLMTDNT